MPLQDIIQANIDKLADKLKDKSFTNQTIMMQRRGVVFDVSNPLCNLWLITRISNEEPTYLLDEQKTYEHSMAMLDRQMKAHQKGTPNVQAMAFVETKTPYVTKEVKTKDLPSLVGSAPFMLFSYPNKRSSTYTTVAFEGDNGEGMCRRFHPDMMQGEKIDRCAALQKSFADSFKYYASEREDRLSQVSYTAPRVLGR